MVRKSNHSDNDIVILRTELILLLLLSVHHSPSEGIVMTFYRKLVNATPLEKCESSCSSIVAIAFLRRLYAFRFRPFRSIDTSSGFPTWNQVNQFEPGKVYSEVNHKTCFDSFFVSANIVWYTLVVFMYTQWCFMVTWFLIVNGLLIAYFDIYFRAILNYLLVSRNGKDPACYILETMYTVTSW